jgi:hypothetical protein
MSPNVALHRGDIGPQSRPNIRSIKSLYDILLTINQGLGAGEEEGHENLVMSFCFLPSFVLQRRKFAHQNILIYKRLWTIHLRLSVIINGKIWIKDQEISLRSIMFHAFPWLPFDRLQSIGCRADNLIILFIEARFLLI